MKKALVLLTLTIFATPSLAQKKLVDEVFEMHKKFQKEAEDFQAEWQAACKKDAMTDKVSCTLTQFDSHIVMSLNGANKPTWVCIFSHDFPGKTGAIRVDQNKAIVTDRDGCVPGEPIFAQMRNGKTIKTQYVQWPDEVRVDASGTLSGLAAGMAEIPNRRANPE